MGVLLITILICAGILYGLYQIPAAKKEMDYCFKYRSTLEVELRNTILVVSGIVFLFIWGIVFFIVRAPLVEKYDKWDKETDIVSYMGTKPDNFVVGRDATYYYVLIDMDQDIVDKKVYISRTNLRKSATETPHLAIKKTVKKNKKI